LARRGLARATVLGGRILGASDPKEEPPPDSVRTSIRPAQTAPPEARAHAPEPLRAVLWLASTDVVENRRGTECAGAV